jgi:hypothetical protein
MPYAHAMHQFDRSWTEGVCRVCDPVFGAADVGFARQIHEEPRRGITALLWEADPQMFAERYPESGIVESYGTGWSGVTCIDFWVYLDAADGTASTSTEGWTSDHEVRDLPLTGIGILDGRAIGAVMARILQVDPPLA